MFTPEGNVLHNTNGAVLWATWLNLVWTVRRPAVLLTVMTGGTPTLLLLGWMGVITMTQGVIMLLLIVICTVTLFNLMLAFRTLRWGHLWVAFGPLCTDPHLWCRLGGRAAAHLTFRPADDNRFLAQGLCAWPQSHQAATRLGSAVTHWADAHEVTLQCTCHDRMVPKYESWGFSVTGTTVGWVLPLRRATLMTMIRKPR